MNPVDWADESFQYVRTDVYNYNPQGGDETDACMLMLFCFA